MIILIIEAKNINNIKKIDAEKNPNSKLKPLLEIDFKLFITSESCWLDNIKFKRGTVEITKNVSIRDVNIENTRTKEILLINLNLK